MIDLISAYWPHILATLSVIMGAAAAIHATMTKEEVRTALGWVGVILLSPIVGALIYAIAGINRIRRSTLGQQRSLMHGTIMDRVALFDAENSLVIERYGRRFVAMKTVGDRVTHNALTTGNSIEPLASGDIAYAAMLEGIESARRSIILETYIFDQDRIGLRFVQALSDAVARGVEVRVLIDAVGARYSVPSILPGLKRAGIKASVFNGNVIMGLRLPYANLRTHRKILVVDGRLAFTGGMNIREGFTAEFAGERQSSDTHFQVKGPLVADLFTVAAEDWRFTTRELLDGPMWDITVPEGEPGLPVLARVVPSGPDYSIETSHKMLMGAFSVARSSIRIMSPYFLPDRELISALTTAARRGVKVDIIVPANNNLTLVDHAMTAQFDQMLESYCRIWRATGPFNHSKLLVIDDRWSYVGSSNLDPRSLRLNFEVDIEVIDEGFANAISERVSDAMENATPVKLDELRARPFALRLFERVLWLASPYL
ncbi:phospholipase D-like domain-containing protein [Agrobacterium sp. rho-13.3]|uniref:phospholipase D-like domain-containing protein n=1 Tax=Agrobacterium sp. rho-13.3 TaxID=3072980 RepID=UPI002A10E4CA|nr:phospholipase D-like domain-containing protein [Agrobacterium sp. rho-13.3]MDX8306423.1 phospholipase D-like domain-containing protein [Agrobacterium sp. rho-13.3]MDX8307246.1 phospholipase D-like domain-containing protein [Agrobacterium sp. rho-13.3]